MTGPAASASLVGRTEDVTVSLALLQDKEGKESGPSCGEGGAGRPTEPGHVASWEVASSRRRPPATAESAWEQGWGAAADHRWPTEGFGESELGAAMASIH